MVTFIVTVLGGMVAMGAVFLTAIYLTAAWVDYQERRQKVRLLREVRRTDSQLTDALRDAKRQMNRAAGQSWRNPFE